jgi:hypothetical protein
MFGGKAPLRLAALKYRPHAPLIGGIQEGNIPNFCNRPILKKILSLIAAILSPINSNHSIFLRQDRPHCGLMFKLNEGLDEQVGFARICLVQNRHGDLYIHLS